MLAVLWLPFLLLAPVAWSQTKYNVIDTIQIQNSVDQLRVVLNFSVLNDSRVPQGADCLANKFVFTDGLTIFSPEYSGYCHVFFNDSTRIEFSLDSKDLLQFVRAGFAAVPNPKLRAHTNDRISEGNFPILAISEDAPINITFTMSDHSGAGVSNIDYFLPDGIMVFQFRTAIRLSTLNTSQLILTSTGSGFDALMPNNSRRLTGGDVLSESLDDLVMSAAVRLNSEDRLFYESNEICTNGLNCNVLYGAELALTFNGNQLNSVTPPIGREVDTVWTLEANQPVHLELNLQFVGYSLRLSLPYGFPYNVAEFPQEVINRVTCYADGINHVDPELFLDGQPIDEQYLTRNWPTQITLSATEGLLRENLLGYFSCKTRNDTFNSSHIIHDGTDERLVYLYEGNSYTVDIQESLVVRFAHNSPVIHNLPAMTESLVQFRVSHLTFTVAPGSIPFTVELSISSLFFYNIGEYSVGIQGGTPVPFTINVNPPQLTVTPTVLAVLPTDTFVDLKCINEDRNFEMTWFLPSGVRTQYYKYVKEARYRLNLEESDFERLEGGLFVCVAYAFKNNPPRLVAVSNASTVFRKVSGVLALVAIDSNGIRTNHNTDESVRSSNFECLGHTLSGAVDLQWIIVDGETQTQTDILTGQSDDSLIATVRGNYITLRFLGNFSGTVTCKSPMNGSEIRVLVDTFATPSSDTPTLAVGQMIGIAVGVLVFVILLVSIPLVVSAVIYLTRSKQKDSSKVPAVPLGELHKTSNTSHEDEKLDLSSKEEEKSHKNIY